MNLAYACARRNLRYTTYAHAAPVLWNTFQKNSDVQNIPFPARVRRFGGSIPAQALPRPRTAGLV